MSLDRLARDWAAAQAAMVAAALAGPTTDSPSWAEYREAVFGALVDRERACRGLLLAWVDAHPETHCEHCGTGSCSVCGRAA